MPTAHHPRTLARRAAGLSLEQAAARIGIKPHSLECWELKPPGAVLTGIAQRRRARLIYGAELVPRPPRHALRLCAGPGCTKQISREHERRAFSGSLRVRGKRFCSYRCRMAYARKLIARSEHEAARVTAQRGRQREAARRPASLTREVRAIVALNEERHAPNR